MQRIHAYGILTAGLGLLFAVAAYLGLGGTSTAAAADEDQPRRAGFISGLSKDHTVARPGGHGQPTTKKLVAEVLVSDDANDEGSRAVPAEVAAVPPTTGIPGTQLVRAPPGTSV